MKECVQLIPCNSGKSFLGKEITDFNYFYTFTLNQSYYFPKLILKRLWEMCKLEKKISICLFLCVIHFATV